jgi:hypothetical protein
MPQLMLMLSFPLKIWKLLFPLHPKQQKHQTNPGTTARNKAAANPAPILHFIPPPSVTPPIRNKQHMGHLLVRSRFLPVALALAAEAKAKPRAKAKAKSIAKTAVVAADP